MQRLGLISTVLGMMLSCDDGGSNASRASQGRSSQNIVEKNNQKNSRDCNGSALKASVQDRALSGDRERCARGDGDQNSGNEASESSATGPASDDKLSNNKAANPMENTAASTVTNTSTSTNTGTSTSTSNVVEFKIAAGTGIKNWNTEATALTLKVGQTLRITNEDDIPHRFHTLGAPCPHQPTAMVKGGSYVCELKTTVSFNPGRDPQTYDHERKQGEKRLFYLNVTK